MNLCLLYKMYYIISDISCESIIEDDDYCYIISRIVSENDVVVPIRFLPSKFSYIMLVDKIRQRKQLQVCK